MSAKKGLGKTFVLLFLVILMALLGSLWFDYLGIIQAKKLFAPVYRLFGLEPQLSVSHADVDFIPADLDSDRFAKRLAALDLREQELDRRESEIALLEAKNQQIMQDLEDRRKSQEEREKTFNNAVKKYDDREVNIVQNAQNLTGMPPAKAVDIMLAMDDQDVIDVLRKTDEIAKAAGTNSMVSYWLSLMPAERVAELNRKMAGKPASIE